MRVLLICRRQVLFLLPHLFGGSLLWGRLLSALPLRDYLVRPLLFPDSEPSSGPWEVGCCGPPFPRKTEGPPLC